MPVNIEKKSRSRSIHDASIAAAIGVSLELAFQSNMQRNYIPATSIESPWVACNRIYMNSIRSGWQIENQWGVLEGWDSIPGKWRSK